MNADVLTIIIVIGFAAGAWLIGFAQGSGAARANVLPRYRSLEEYDRLEQNRDVWRDKAIELMNRLSQLGALTPEERLARAEGEQDYVDRA